MNTFRRKKELEKKLFRRGMLQTIDGQVINPPNRLFKNLGEEVLWILNEAEDVKLSTTDLSNYLCTNIKTMQKVLRKLTASNVNLVEKKKTESNKVFYKANFNKDLDIPTIYKLTRMEATKHIR